MSADGFIPTRGGIIPDYYHVESQQPGLGQLIPDAQRLAETGTPATQERAKVVVEKLTRRAAGTTS